VRTEIKINDAIQTVIEKSLILTSRLSPRKSTAQFDIEGENIWAPAALSTTKRTVAFGGFTNPKLWQSVAINRGRTPFVNCATTRKVVALGGNATYIDNYFGGYVMAVEHYTEAVRPFYRIFASDYNARASKILVTKTYAAPQTEQQIIDDIFSTYWTEIDTTTYVDGTNNIASIDFPRVTLDKCLDQIALMFSKEWYIGHDKKLHYFTPNITDAPFGLSDAPYLTTRIPYSNFLYREHINDIINRITVIGRTAAGADIVEVRTDAASYAKYGDYFDSKYVDRNIDTVVWAQAVGDAILAQDADAKVYGQLTCTQDGLVVGQKVLIVNSIRNLNTYYLIQAITLRMLGELTPQVTIIYGDYTPELVELLLAVNELSKKEDV